MDKKTSNKPYVVIIFSEELPNIVPKMKGISIPVFIDRDDYVNYDSKRIIEIIKHGEELFQKKIKDNG